jgi:hypothetical protein
MATPECCKSSGEWILQFHMTVTMTVVGIGGVVSKHTQLLNLPISQHWLVVKSCPINWHYWELFPQHDDVVYSRLSTAP